MPKHPLTNFAFLDFEASSLRQNSWPIEIGISWFDDAQRVQTFSSLIRPHSSWPMVGWSTRSARVHGISYDSLNDAPDVVTVTEQSLKVIGNRTLLADAPKHDGGWLQQLLDAAGCNADLQVKRYYWAVEENFTGRTADIVHERLALIKAPHRAGPDSARLAKAWARELEVDG